ncbi:ADP-ribose glycohydrolase MACROD2-like isoform X1 [Schistocerca piceifrons]|uniref:ADP-ribose glycohydrolase MACROD2-like isoform X1 n=2 Tax=Schistocerca piceifrons TaxID=274613 RepID=UPI001F5EB5B6|nr:ADP-ribose glycohydrolase MACROD2-like isoform X1 [Schistocerca piceifrons]
MLTVPVTRNLAAIVCGNSQRARKFWYLTCSFTNIVEKRNFTGRRGMAGAAKIVNLDHVDTWDQYFKKNRDRLKDHFANAKVQCDPDARYSPNNNLSKKVSIWQGDITKLEIDAIVNAANSSLMGGGGVDGAIHRAAGPELKNECKGLGGCEAGDAKITKGYKLSSKNVIHTVGPRGENPGLLKSCYDTCLNILVNNNLRTVAFPCISTGVYGYPPNAAANVALKTVRSFLEKQGDSVDRVIFCLFLENDVKIYEYLLQAYFPVE